MRIIRGIRWFLGDYMARHRNAVNLTLHMVGVPQALFGIFQICTGRWQWGGVNLFLGYFWQWLGHTRFEKNEVGELLLIKSVARNIARRLRHR